jgi:hypothetical protein
MAGGAASGTVGSASADGATMEEVAAGASQAGGRGKEEAKGASIWGHEAIR